MESSPYIFYKSGYKYQTTREAVFITECFPNADVELGFLSLLKDGTLTIRAGYAWDGPSGPTIDTPSFIRGSLAHDALYQILRYDYLYPDFKRAADQLLYSLCLEDDMWELRALWVLIGVQGFSGDSALPDGKKEEQIAPLQKRGE